MSPVPPLTDLPVEDCVDAVRAALADAGHAVLQAQPGAGKTTIVPLRLLEEPWLLGDRILVLEPRRLAARAAARRMASLLGENVGDTVGYRTRDESRVGRRTRIEVVTDGILTRRLQSDPELAGVGLVVFDEIHERNLQSDLALAFTLDARRVLRPDLRVLAMSATLDTERVAAVLATPAGEVPDRGTLAPVIVSEGRSFPVEVHWRPLAPLDRPAEAVVTVVAEAMRSHPGDVLVFLAGAADIRRVAGLLAHALPHEVDVRPLYGALSNTEQDEALIRSPGGRRRVVLATDIAETSLTVEGVRIVVDSGQVRSPRFDTRTGLTRLHTGANSRASADQRAGRAGRTESGVAYRLWSEGEHASRRPFAPPEIASVDLAGFALELAMWGTPVRDLTFLDAPPATTLTEAFALLRDLGAIEASGRASDAGRAMGALPVHPRLAHMILRSAEVGHGEVACTIAALIEERDVLRGRPDELPTDIGERVRLILDPKAKHPDVDRQVRSLVQRRAQELARRMRIHSGGRDVLDTPCGPILALAYPDRVAQATGRSPSGSARFRLRHGAGARLPEGDALTGEAFLVVASLDAGRQAPPSAVRGGPAGRVGADRPSGGGDNVIRLAAALDATDIADIAADAVEAVSTLVWDPDLDDLRLRTEHQLGALVLATRDTAADPGPETVAALLERVRATGLGMLRWTDAARALQARVGYAHRALGGDWPDLSDDALAESLDEWLAPQLVTAIRRDDVERVDMVGALRDRLGHHRIAELDRIVPTTITIANGRTVKVDYTGDAPHIAVRVQEVFGTRVHPAVAHGRVPVVVELLSPAGRPIQVTADLPGFWSGSWADVRKDMAGRYPKHDWPTDPASVKPVSRQGGRRG